MNPTVVYALLSALIYGVGDFVGGLASRVNPPIRVIALTHPLGLLIYAAVALLTHEPLPDAAHLGLAALAGVVGMLGVALFFRALVIGPMGLVSVTSGALGAVVPVAAGLLAGETLGPARASGLVLILTGIVVFSLAPAGGAAGRGGVPLGVVSGLAFGLFFVLLARASGGAVFWALATARLSSSALALPLAARAGGLRPQSWGLLLLSVPGDTLGNLFFTLASQGSRLAVAGLLTNLYPVFTALMAAVVLRERLRRTQWLGAGVALAGVLLVS